MALSPVITATLGNQGQTMTVTDATGVYNVTTNPTGWETPNAAGSSITAATLTITYASGGTQIVDVLSQIPSTVTGSFAFTAITLSGYVDGITTIRYDLSTSTANYAYDLNLLFTCNVRACIDKMWATIACKSCAGSCDLPDLVDDANLAEGLYKALMSGAACSNADCVDKILATLADLCSWGNCNC
jgi:hypothetical protein